MSDLLGGLVSEFRERLAHFETAAHDVLGQQEEAVASRVVSLDKSYAELAKLSLQQDDLFRQALRCVENELYRAAHVMAWAAFMDFFGEKLASDGLVKVKQARPTWKGATIEEMREYVAEYALIEVAQPVGLCTKNQVKALHGLLNRRNECGHPSAYFPGLNETLGFISELFQRIKTLQPRTI